MLRLSGILTGSALAIAVLYIAVGIPRVAEPPAATTGWPDVGNPVVRAESAVTNPAAAERHVAPTEAASEPAPTPEPAPQVEHDAAPVRAAVDHQDAVTPAPPAVAADTKWFAFWSPFRSQIAADGFVSGLQRTTGLDYRVVKLKPGVFEVAFEYSDDSDRRDKLSRIAAATGLDLPDG